MADDHEVAFAPTVAQTDRSTMLAAQPNADALSNPGRVELAEDAHLREEGARYVAQKMLGEGGMGEVRLESDRRTGRDVAVKRLRSELGDRIDARIRFLREARVQAQLEHPAVVPVYDIEEDSQGELSFVMRRIRGRTLRETIEQTREGKRRLLSAFSQVCLAVQYAHSRGVIHRDLKPENIMLGDFGEVYVLDWGLARLIESEEPARASRVPIEAGGTSGSTRHGSVMGTPGYMAPEQMAGQLDRLDARSDVYALGAILFELLTGERLHQGSTLDAIRVSTSAGVEARVLERCEAHEAAPELTELCRHALCTTTADRLESARALSEGIEGFLDGDRDAAIRREKATAHARAASAAASRAFEEDDVESRSLAAREAGRALALDPDNDEGRRTLVELLTRPPKRMPAAAEASFEAQEAAQLGDFYKSSLVVLAIYVPIIVVLWLTVPVLEPWAVASACLMMLVFAGLCVTGLKRPAAALIPLLGHVAGCAGLLFFSRLAGPLIVLPVLAAVNTIVVALFPSRSPRWAIALVGVSPMLLSGAAELLGLWPATMAIVAGELHITPRLFDFGDALLPVVFGLSALPPLLCIGAIGEIRDRSRKAERQLHLQRWQLAQIVPHA